MRPVRITLAILVVALLGSTVVAPADATVTNPQLMSLAVTPVSTTVTGTGVAHITITAHLSIPYTQGSCPSSSSDPTYSYQEPVIPDTVVARLTPGISGGVGLYQPRVSMRRISGSLNDGVWQGYYAATSTFARTWTVASITACNSEGYSAAAVPLGVVPPASFSVGGVHPPRLEWTFIPGIYGGPHPRKAFNRTRVVDWQGRPIAGVSFQLDTVAFDGECALPPSVRGFPTMVVSGVDGLGPAFYSTDDGATCLSATYNGALLFFQTLPSQPYYLSAVTAHASAHRVTQGQIVGVTGAVRPYWNGIQPMRASLQVRGTTGEWRSLATSRVRPSGRYTVSARLNLPSGWRMRVAVFPQVTATNPWLLPTTSASFRISVIGCSRGWRAGC